MKRHLMKGRVSSPRKPLHGYLYKHHLSCKSSFIFLLTVTTLSCTWWIFSSEPTRFEQAHLFMIRVQKSIRLFLGVYSKFL